MTIGESLRSAWNFVSGQGAQLSLELDTRALRAGDELGVRVVVQSTGVEVFSRGVKLDLVGEETLDPGAFQVLDFANPQRTRPHDLLVGGSTTTLNAHFRLCEAFRLEPSRSVPLRARVRVPANARPTYAGVNAQHVYKVRARLDVTGTDPTSEWLPLTVAARV